MSDTVLVLGELTERQFAMLAELPKEIRVVVGKSAEDFAGAAADATVIFYWSGSRDVLRDVFLKCPKLRWVHSKSAGLDNALFPELIEGPVTLTNGSGTFSPALAEFAVGAILFFVRDFRRMIRNQTAGVWQQFPILRLSGQTVGIIGYGDIGRAVAARARGLEMKVLAVRRHVPAARGADPLVEEVYTPDRRIEMLSRCDFIVASAPLTAETRGMIGGAEFAAMKPTAVVINIGRGPVIDETAMIKALSEGRIKGAALDVFDHEPLPVGHAFYKLENVLLSPHCADHTPDWKEMATRLFLEQFERFRKGEKLLNVVEKKLGY